MTLQVHPSGAERGGGASTVDAYPLPFSVGNKEIVGADPDSSLIIREEDQFPGSRTNVVVESSNNVTVGNRTVFNGDVTIFQNINRNSLRTLHAGTLENDVECKKKIEVVVAESTKSEIGTKSFTCHLKLISIIVGTLLLTSIGAMIIVEYVKKDEFNYEITFSSTKISKTDPTPNIFTISQWGGRNPTSEEKLSDPASLVIIKHTVTSQCYDVPHCFVIMQQMQSIDVGEYNLSNIRYNFAIGGDGNIYEGRGWGVKNEEGKNIIDMAFIGNFEEYVPNKEMLDAGQFLIQQGLNESFLDFVNLKLVAHNQTTKTKSPGKNLYKEIVSWPYYSKEIITSHMN